MKFLANEESRLVVKIDVFTYLNTQNIKHSMLEVAENLDLHLGIRTDEVRELRGSDMIMKSHFVNGQQIYSHTMLVTKIYGALELEALDSINES